jgi:hypothetical protein
MIPPFLPSRFLPTTLLLAVVSCGTPWPALAQEAAVAPKKPFLVVEAMKYPNRPDLSSFGVPRCKVIYESALVTKDKQAPLPTEKLRALAATLTAGPVPVVLDIETWPLRGDKAERERNAPRLITVIDTLRQARPDLQFGYYGEVPERTYWPLVRPGSGEKLRAWEAGNEMALTDIAPHVDAVFPSLYTFYEDQEGWKTYATGMLKAARKFQKPVYAFLWPKFHDRKGKLKDQYLSGDYWKMELELCHRLADGVVIWNSESKPWDPEAAWWKETVGFVAGLKR